MGGSGGKQELSLEATPSEKGESKAREKDQKNFQVNKKAWELGREIQP